MLLNWIPSKTIAAVDGLNLSIQVHAVPEIDELLSKTVLYRGKKFRPILCFLMGELFHVPLKELEPYARAAEFVHAATLAHDDVIDESFLRRNRPTLNAKVSNARAVLAGDLLLARVMSELSALGKISIIQDLAFTVEELVHGEWLQLEARKVVSVQRSHLETVAQKKTASLMVWCCGTAARLANLNLDQIELCQKFAEYLGVSFQMIDDILDYDLGGEKPFAQDIREGLVNFVTLEMLEQNPSLKEPVSKLLENVEPSTSWPWSSDELHDAQRRVRGRAQAKLEAAGQLLDQITSDSTSSDAEEAFRSILVFLRDRVK